MDFLKGHGIHAALIEDASVPVLDPAGAKPQLVLLDLACIPPEGLAACVQACSRAGVPAIALVPSEKVARLDAAMGLDDFVVCPPHSDELVTRARIAVARTGRPESQGTIRFDNLVIDPESYQVTLDGRRLNLTFKEYELLRLLAATPGRVYTREILMDKIWGYDFIGGTRTVDVHIRRLRRKLDDAENKFIETIWNVGYRFRALASPS